MPLPDRLSTERALLELLGDGRVHDDNDIVASLVKRFGLTAADLREQIANTGRSRFGNQIDWVKGDLGEGKRGKKLIRRIAAKSYQILPAGLTVLGTSAPVLGQPVESSEVAVAPSGEPPPMDLGDEFDEETELQKALRDNIQQLEDGLTITDGGTERVVPSGRIDITAKDKNGVAVVIELKRGTADRDAVAQVAAYMGDVSADGSPVRGMLIAHEFSPRALSAARMIGVLELRRYGYRFTFEKIS